MYIDTAQVAVGDGELFEGYQAPLMKSFESAASQRSLTG